MTTDKPVTDEQIEAVASAISSAAYDAMRAQGFSGGWDHDEFGRAIAKAAINAMSAATPNEAKVTEALRAELAEVRAERDALLQKPIDLAKMDSVDDDATDRMIAYYWWRQAQDARAALTVARPNPEGVTEARQHVMPGDPDGLGGIALRWYCNFDWGAPHTSRESNMAVEGFKDGYRAALAATRVAPDEIDWADDRAVWREIERAATRVEPDGGPA